MDLALTLTELTQAWSRNLRARARLCLRARVFVRVCVPLCARAHMAARVRACGAVQSQLLVRRVRARGGGEEGRARRVAAEGSN
jgi:hypothetical protein